MGLNLMGPEKLFENKVKAFILEQDGWFVKFFANRMTKSGIPDILACINGYFIAIEIKAQNGKPSKLQIRNCNQIRTSGGQAFILYPSGFNEFKEVIKGLNQDLFYNKPLILK